MSGLITDKEIQAAKVGRHHTGDPGLPTQAVALLAGLREYADPARNPYVFVGSANRDRKPRSISPTGMYQYLTATLHIHNGTVHGFRTGFRNWAAENGVDFIAAEHALAHRAGNAV